VGLEAGMVAQLPVAGVEPGTVLAQDPPAKAQGIEKPSVNLLVAAQDDAPPDGFAMPDLTGLPILSAEAQLTRVGIKFGEPKFQDVAIPAVSAAGYAPVSADVGANATVPAQIPATPAIPKSSAPPGSVLSQSPPAGYRVEVGSTVALTVAK
jgi:beta-lactam-binding protein with PASTA domain